MLSMQCKHSHPTFHLASLTEFIFKALLKHLHLCCANIFDFNVIDIQRSAPENARWKR
jgi:hypothetical protein